MKSKDAENLGGDAELEPGSAPVPPARYVGDLPDAAESLSPLGWFLSAAFLAGACLVGEVIVGCAGFFSPGWANDWPFSLSFHTVLSVAITGWYAVMLLTAAAGAGAFVGCGCAVVGVGHRYSRRVYGGWLLFAAVVILFLSVWIFWSTYAEVLREFPGGYHVASKAAGRIEVSFRGSWERPEL